MFARIWRRLNVPRPTAVNDQIQSSLLAHQCGTDARFYWVLVIQWGVVLFSNTVMTVDADISGSETFTASVLLATILTVIPLAMVLVAKMERRVLKSQSEGVLAIESLRAESQEKMMEAVRGIEAERANLKSELVALKALHSKTEAARFAALRGLLTLQREFASRAKSIQDLVNNPTELGVVRQWNAGWQALRTEAEGMLRTAQPGSAVQSKATVKVASTAPVNHFNPVKRPFAMGPLRKKALLVMQDRFQQEKTVAALESEGYTVEITPSGAGSYYSVMMDDYSVIVVDIDLPDEEGFDTIEAMRMLPAGRVGSSNCLFAITTERTSDRVLRCMELAVDGILVKPLSAATIRQSFQSKPGKPPVRGLPQSTSESSLVTSDYS